MYLRSWDYRCISGEVRDDWRSLTPAPTCPSNAKLGDREMHRVSRECCDNGCGGDEGGGRGRDG